MLTAERLRKIVSYDPRTGKFFWLDRSKSEFANSQAYGVFVARYRGKEAGGHQGDGYLRFSISGKHYLAHRLAWLYVHGTWPSDQIDHINGNRSDNRIENLRNVAHSENRRNTKRFTTNTSGVPGVRFQPRFGTWAAKIHNGKKAVHLGTFQRLDDAIAARKSAEQRLGYHPNHGRAA